MLSSAASPSDFLRRGLILPATLVLLTASTLLQAQFGTTIDVHPLTKLAPEGTSAVALFFVASDCPISDRTFPEMKHLREEFASRGVKIYFVYPNSTERRSDITAHQHDFDPGGEILLDPTGDLVRLTHARATPEVSVLVPSKTSWHSVYTGRIDDRYIHLGLERPRPTHIFAEEVLTAVLSGQPILKPTGNPIGCAIVNPATTGAASTR